MNTSALLELVVQWQERDTVARKGATADGTAVSTQSA